MYSSESKSCLLGLAALFLTCTSAITPYATPQGLSEDLNEWLATNVGTEAAIAKTRMFANIEPNVNNAAKGTVVAAQSGPSYASTAPDYEYNWVRDSSLTMDVVRSLYNQSSNASQQSKYETILFNYAQSRAAEQNLANLPNGLGTPKFNLDNTVYTGYWPGPQLDGPATSAVTLMKFANAYLAKGGSIDTVKQKIYDSTTYPTSAPVKRDLLYIAANWTTSCIDLWEESQGDHFYTRMVQRNALVTGANFATAMGDSATSSTLTNAATALTATLSTFWNATEGLIRYENDGYVINGKTSYKDTAVILGVIHGYAGDGTFSYTNDQVLSSAFEITTTFLSVYPIAATHEDKNGYLIGIPVGRYPEDTYNGVGNLPNGGNPWYLTTAAIAELFYNAILEYRSTGSLTVTSTSASFFAYFTPTANLVTGTTYSSTSTEFLEAIRDLEGWADAFIRRIKFHTPSDGSLTEEYGRNTGSVDGAKELTWSYASLLTATFARALVDGDTSYVQRLADLA